MSTLQENARKVADLIRDPARWTSDALARNTFGDSVAERDAVAVCWCAGGAILRILGWDTTESEQLRAELHSRCGGNFVVVNDGPDGHARILAALDAIAEGK